MKVQQFKRFLSNNRIYHQFQLEIEHQYRLEELEVVADILDDFFDSHFKRFECDLPLILNNGFSFYYKGKKKSNCTNVDWDSYNKMWETVSNTDEVLYKLGSYENHTHLVNYKSNIKVGMSINYLGDDYIIGKDLGNYTPKYIAKKILKSGKISDKKQIILSNRMIKKK